MRTQSCAQNLHRSQREFLEPLPGRRPVVARNLTFEDRRHARTSRIDFLAVRAWIDPHGYDAGKKIKGKKRHLLVDTLGLLLHAVVHPVDIQDRDGGIMLLSTLFGLFPFLQKLFADSAYQGPLFNSDL